MSEPSRAALPLSFALFLLAACGGDGDTAPSTTVGAIKVTAVTTGHDIDPDGYTAQVGSAAQPLGLKPSTTFNGLETGDYTVELTGAASNCAVAGENPRTVTVAAGATVTTSFDVACTFALRGRIAFAAIDNGYQQIYAVNPDGSNRVKISSDPAVDDGNPAWSPDGRRIAFVSVGTNTIMDIFVMNADGSNRMRLTHNQTRNFDRGPAWSPDGTRIAFSSELDGNFEIYVMNADGSNLVRLTNDPRVDWQPTWSPDGTRIAFAAYRDGNGEIYVMNADGSNPVRLTNDPAEDQQPAWSPDGTRIAFRTFRDGNDEIYVMHGDGSNPINVTNDPTGDREPTWSPDGTRIAFATYRGGSNIYVMNADGSNPVSVTNDFNDND